MHIKEVDNLTLDARIDHAKWLFGSPTEPDKFNDKKLKVTVRITEEQRDGLVEALEPLWERAQEEFPEASPDTTWADLFKPSTNKDKAPDGGYRLQTSTAATDKGGARKQILLFDRSGQRIPAFEGQGSEVSIYVRFRAVKGPPDRKTKKEPLFLVAYVSKLQILARKDQGLEVVNFDAEAEETQDFS
jgi:hypothetical protein